MNPTVFVVLAAVIMVALMVLGLSITQIRKGRDLQSEVGENDEMKKRGLKCASQEMIEEEKALGLIDGDCGDFVSCSLGSCNTCTEHADTSVVDKEKAN
ncbi:MAG: hypothetical protein R3Y51_05400 [Rikenellaceae bacterium]